MDQAVGGQPDAPEEFHAAGGRLALTAASETLERAADLAGGALGPVPPAVVVGHRLLQVISGSGL
ncbi:hypothetical protein Acsp07_46040 [Actinomycetospora sp. NBRC 106378]|nr:hypothetical protein Acsp07_46040 [Actinomycetospora sp. NBRC 106378]